MTGATEPLIGCGDPADRRPPQGRAARRPTPSSRTPGERPAFLAVVQSTINRGRITRLDPAAAEARRPACSRCSPPGTRRGCRRSGTDLAVLQSLDVQYQGEVVAAWSSPRRRRSRATPRPGAVEYAAEEPDVDLSADRPDLYAPEQLMAGFETDSVIGDVDGALAAAAVTIDATYETPTQHNNPIEMHATIARWDGDSLTLWDANQGPHNIVGPWPPGVRDRPRPGAGDLALRRRRVRCQGVSAPEPDARGARRASVVGRPVVYELTRQQMFSLVGHRTPTIQRLRLGAIPRVG